MIDFSIIIPAYNVEKYIRRCVDSVLNQTYKNYEIIVVNDGSTDDTYNILKKEYKKKNIKLVDKKNGGLSSARNTGLQYAEGEYIIFLDSDDWWEKDLLNTLKDTISKTDADIVCFKLQKYYEKENIYKKINIPSFDTVIGINALKKLLESHLTFETAVTYAYKFKFWNLNKFSFSEGRLHEDFGLTPYVIAKAEKVVSIDYIGYNYYQRDGSITSYENYPKLLKKCLDTIYHFKYLKDKFLKLNLDNYTKDLVANYLMNAVITKSIKLNNKDQKEIYKKLKKYKAYELFKNGSIESYIKYILIKINPKCYKYFI